MKKYVNLTGMIVYITYSTRPEHYEQGHSCDCELRTVSIDNESFFTFENSEPHAAEIDQQCINNGLTLCQPQS